MIFNFNNENLEGYYSDFEPSEPDINLESPLDYLRSPNLENMINNGDSFYPSEEHKVNIPREYSESNNHLFRTSYSTLNTSEDKTNRINNIIPESNPITKESLTKRGRKRKDEKERPVTHGKSSEDNEMRRIKTNFINHIFKELNSSLSGHKKFLKINKKFKENLNIKDNIELMDMTIAEIIENNTAPNENINSKNHNQTLIKEIFEKNKDKKAIKILNTKYIDLLDDFKNKHLDTFLRDIYKKDIKKESKEDVQSYIDDIRQLVFGFEFWFKSRIPRKPRKKNNKQFS